MKWYQRLYFNSILYAIIVLGFKQWLNLSWVNKRIYTGNSDLRIEMQCAGNMLYSYDDGTHWYYVVDDKLAFYSPDGSDKALYWSIRACPKCKRMVWDDDPCLGHIDGVQNACCGHGIEDGYIHTNVGEHMDLPNGWLDKPDWYTSALLAKNR